jgi:hypothetical protein
MRIRAPVCVCVCVCVCVRFVILFSLDSSRTRTHTLSLSLYPSIHPLFQAIRRQPASATMKRRRTINVGRRPTTKVTWPSQARRIVGSILRHKHCWPFSLPVGFSLLLLLFSLSLSLSFSRSVKKPPAREPTSAPFSSSPPSSSSPMIMFFCV